jgi:hypothetical protein
MTFNELEGIWREVDVAKFDLLSQHLPAETEEKR